MRNQNIAQYTTRSRILTSERSFKSQSGNLWLVYLQIVPTVMTKINTKTIFSTKPAVWISIRVGIIGRGRRGLFFIQSPDFSHFGKKPGNYVTRQCGRQQ